MIVSDLLTIIAWMVAAALATLGASVLYSWVRLWWWRRRQSR